jgi:PPOX class probable F420-dependent enzyme
MGCGTLMTMYVMSRDQWWDFAMAGTRTGKVATVRADGRAHVAPVWFLLDERDGHDEIVFNTGAETVKGKALRRDPRFGMSVDDENAPYSFVTFEAHAEISEDPDEMLAWATRLATRYMGEEKGAEYGGRNAVPGELLVRGRITRVVAQADLAD